MSVKKYSRVWMTLNFKILPEPQTTTTKIKKPSCEFVSIIISNVHLQDIDKN